MGGPAARRATGFRASGGGCRGGALEHDEAANKGGLNKPQTSPTVLRGRGLAAPPPAEKTTARQDQAGQASTGDGAGNCTNLLTLRKGGRAAIGTAKWSSQNKVIKSSGCSVVSNQEIVSSRWQPRN